MATSRWQRLAGFFKELFRPFPYLDFDEAVSARKHYPFRYFDSKYSAPGRMACLIYPATVISIHYWKGLSLSPERTKAFTLWGPLIDNGPTSTLSFTRFVGCCEEGSSRRCRWFEAALGHAVSEDLWAAFESLRCSDTDLIALDRYEDFVALMRIRGEEIVAAVAVPVARRETRRQAEGIPYRHLQDSELLEAFRVTVQTVVDGTPPPALKRSALKH